MENIEDVLVPKMQGFSFHETNCYMIRSSDDFQAKYDWLKSSDRDAEMGVLSATNRRTLVLAPGTYTPPATLVLDTDFVDICSITGKPTTTIITGTLSPAIVEQSANDVILSGFVISNTFNAPTGFHAALKISATNNAPSKYYFMHFRRLHGGPLSVTSDNCSVSGYATISGFWWCCEADKYAWNCKKNFDLAATMYYCIASDGSFFRDNEDDVAGTGKITGTFIGCTGGNYCFGGCSAFGSDCTGYFQDCVAGYRSFGMGKTFSGTAIRCIGGQHCFGGYQGSGSYYGTFSGVAIDCIATGNSFGSGGASCVCSGQLIRCQNTAMLDAMYCTGARITDSYLQITGTDKNCLFLNDSNSKIYNNTLIANGTGKSINAGSALNVCALHCRMNLDKGSNVTNLVGDGSLAAGYCIVDSDIT